MFFFFFETATFADRLKSLRKGKNVSQVVLAEGLGVTRTQISDMENGKTTTTIEKLVALADYFEVSLDYLVGRTDDPVVHWLNDEPFEYRMIARKTDQRKGDTVSPDLERDVLESLDRTILDNKRKKR